MRRATLVWGLLLVPMIGGVFATRIAEQPAVVLAGLRPGLIDSFGGEIFVARGDEVVAFDGAANLRVVFGGLPADVSAIAWDPAERFCWSSGSTIGCVDLVTRRIDTTPFAQRIRDLQLACDGVVVLLDEPGRVVHRTTAGEQVSWPVEDDVKGLARGVDCRTVGVWSPTRVGDVSLADGSFHAGSETGGIQDAVRSGGGWLLRRENTITELSMESKPSKSWSVAGALSLAAGRPNALVDREGRLWLLP